MQEEESVEVGLETMKGGIKEGRVAEVGGEEEEEEEETWSSDTEIENALGCLDLKDGGEAVDGTLRSQFSMSECSWRASHACPVAHASTPVQSEPETLPLMSALPLGRLKAAGIRCPAPHLLKLHVLVMDFIGKAGWAAPRLKDAASSLDKLRDGYRDICQH